MSTQEAFGRILGGIAASDSELASRIVTTSPDVTVSTNLGAWVNRRGIFDRAERQDIFRTENVVSSQRWPLPPQCPPIHLRVTPAARAARADGGCGPGGGHHRRRLVAARTGPRLRAGDRLLRRRGARSARRLRRDSRGPVASWGPRCDLARSVAPRLAVGRERGEIKPCWSITWAIATRCRDRHRR